MEILDKGLCGDQKTTTLLVSNVRTVAYSITKDTR